MKDFLRDNKYKSEITQAIAYEKQLAYFIQTHLSDTVFENTSTSIDNLWNSSNPFINWVKGWMIKENFASYLKFLRNPLPTAGLIQDDIVPELKKVFDSTNAYYNYAFTSNANKQSSEVLINKYADFYKDEVFQALINNHNSIVITDYVDNKEPYRFIINISDVEAIEPTLDGNIKAIVFKGINTDNEERYYYYTDKFYAVYKKYGEDFIEESKNEHNINKCPADFISVEPLNNEKFVVRKSLFSNLLEKFESYVNYYILQKMCIPHGAIPVITHYKQKNKPCGTKFENGTSCNGGYLMGASGMLGGNDELVPCPKCNNKTIIQAGTVIGLPIPKFGENGESPIDLNANFVKFHYIPTDILTWFNEFVPEKYSEIKYQIIGKGVEAVNGQAKNTDQIARGNQTLENTLIELSTKLSKLRKSLDYKMLKIAYDKSFVNCSIDMGSDFYLETEFELRDSLAKSIDPIDKENLINRINYSIYKNNPVQLERSNLLYKLLPYSTITDTEFISMMGVDPKLKELRLNYNYYIDLFEANFGELNIFFTDYFGENISMGNKLEVARKLLLDKVVVIEPKEEEVINNQIT